MVLSGGLFTFFKEDRQTTADLYGQNVFSLLKSSDRIETQINGWIASNSFDTGTEIR